MTAKDGSKKQKIMKQLETIRSIENPRTLD